MSEYVVAWTIDQTAESPVEAARQALRVQRNPASIATVFTVTDQATGESWQVDLDDLEGTEPGCTAPPDS